MISRGARVPEWIREALVSLRPPGRMTVSEWADAHRVLTSGESSRPGRWKTETTPYLRAVMDAFNDPEVEEIIFVKPTQVGGTEAMLNMIGFAVCEDPAPMLMVYPQKELGEWISDHRIQPMVRACPDLKKKYDENSKRLELNFAGGIYIGIVGANSPSDLAGRPVRFVLLDEEDKFPARAGKEASPAALAMERQKTYPASKKTMRASTPVFEGGPIWQSWRRANTQMECFVSCPHCSAQWIFQFKQLKWPEGASEEEARQQAFYVCTECGGVITEAQKSAMVQHCQWRATQTDGSRRRIAFRLNTFYSPWVRFGDIAAEFIRSKDYPELLQNFINSWLGEPFKEIESQMDAEQLLESRQSVYQRGEVPTGTVMLTGGVDVQKKCFYWTIRAWKSNMTSYNIAHGQVFSWLEVEEVMDGWYRDRTGRRYQVNLYAVDSGDQTDDVYNYCAVHRESALPSKGSSTRMITRYRMTAIDRDGISKGMPLMLVDTDYYKDMIFSRFFRDEDNGGWYLHDKCDPEYAEMVTAEQKVIARERGHLVSRWKQKAVGADNHYLDCEVYAAAAADVYGLRTIRAQEVIRERQEDEPAIAPVGIPPAPVGYNGYQSGSFRKRKRWHV